MLREFHDKWSTERVVQKHNGGGRVGQGRHRCVPLHDRNTLSTDLHWQLRNVAPREIAYDPGQFDAGDEAKRVLSRHNDSSAFAATEVDKLSVRADAYDIEALANDARRRTNVAD